VTIDDFRSTLTADTPPAVSPALRALWHDGRGEWAAAHGVAQDIDDATGAWVHAYLHRKEGDLENAAYWYRRAQQPNASGSPADEWERLVETLLKTGAADRAAQP
jgi:hypothetical protein